MTLGHRRLECRQVNLPQGPLIHFGVHVVPVVLLAVHRIVLHRGDHALRLHSLDKRNYQVGIEERILGEILEVAPCNGRAGDIHSGAEQKIDTAGAGVSAQTLAYLARQSRVPGGGQRHSPGIGCGGSPGAHAQ